VSLSALFHLYLFSLSFFSHAKHSISSRLVMAAHRPWTKLSVNTFTISLDFFELFLGFHEPARCVHDATPKAMVSPVNHIIINFHS
jgi:hypothetical protein